MTNIYKIQISIRHKIKSKKTKILLQLLKFQRLFKHKIESSITYYTTRLNRLEFLE